MRSGARSPVVKWRNRRLIGGNLRKFTCIKPLLPSAARKKRRHPRPMPPGRLFDRGPVDATPPFRKVLQLLQGSVEKAKPAGVCAPFDMVIRRRQLDEALQKKMDVRLRLEPDRLPR